MPRKCPCYVATIEDTIASQLDKVSQLEKAGVIILKVNKGSNGKICMFSVMDNMVKLGLNNVMIEAGANINTAAMQLKLVDRIYWFRAPIIIGHTGLPAFKNMNVESLSTIDGHTHIDTKSIGKDSLNIFACS